jgi:hypothetical protein
MKSLKGSIKLLTLTVPMLALTGCVNPSAQPAPTVAAHTSANPANADCAAPRKRGISVSVTVVSADGGKCGSAAAEEYLRAALIPYAECIRTVEPPAPGASARTEDTIRPDALLTVTLSEHERTDAGADGGMAADHTRTALLRLTSMRDGIVMAAFEVTASARPDKTENGVATEARLLKSLMEQTAEKLAVQTSRRLNVGISGPEGDTAFETENVLLYLDGEAFENGGRVPFGEYTLRAECDGYRPVTRRIRINSRRLGKIKLTFEKVDDDK